MEKFKVIIVEDVLLELKGTEGLLHSEVPEAEIIATANSEDSFWEVFASNKPDLVFSTSVLAEAQPSVWRFARS